MLARELSCQARSASATTLQSFPDVPSEPSSATRSGDCIDASCHEKAEQMEVII